LTGTQGQPIAKLTRPGFSSVCLRKRLFAMIDRGRRGRVVWISGPPGAGKTILASSYIESRGLECLWYRADAADADPATFFYYLSRASGGGRGRKKPLPLFTPEYAHGISVFASRFFEELFCRLKTGACLVIDNFHEVAPPDFHTALREGLSAMPESMSAIIMSRGGPPANFASLIASGSVSVIGPGEIALTPAEARKICELKLGKKASRKDSDALFRTTGGWAAGLALMLEEEKASGRGGGPVSGLREKVFGYFAAEVFGRMDEPARSLLLKTSILDEFDPATAGRVSGVREAAAVLEDLHKGNFFTEKRPLPAPVYQYHPLFREFLRGELERSYDEKSIRQLRIRAASALEELRNPEAAIELLAAASEWERLGRVLKSSAREIMAQGRHQRLSRWLSLIPRSSLSADPWLLFWSGASTLPSGPGEARKLLAAAYRLFKSLKDPAGLYLSWSAIADTFYYEWKDFRPLDAWIRELGRLRKTYPEYPSKEVGERVVSAMFGSLVFRQPHSSQLPAWEKEVREAVFGPGENASRVLICNNLVFYYLWKGEYARAAVALESLSSAFGTRLPDLPGIMWCIVNALYNFHVSNYAEALDWIEKGLSASDESGIRLLKPKLFGLGSMSAIMGQRSLREAEAFSKGMKETMDRSNSFDLIYYHQQASRISLAKGDLGGTLENIRLASGYAEKLGAPFLVALTEVIFAYYLAEAGEGKEARGRLRSVRRVASETGSSLLEYISLMTEAVLMQKSGKEKECLASLSRALAIGKKNGLRFLTVNLPETSAALLALAMKKGVETAFAGELIRSNALACPDPGMEEWPWQVKVRALGPFEVWKDGEKVQFTRKAQQKPFELLKAVISLGCRGVSERAVSDLLWPEAEGDAAHSAFATTLHRLRQLLDGNKLLELKNGRLTLDFRYCWVDAWALEAALKRAEASFKAGSTPDAHGETDTALALYRGEFLSSDLEAPWTAQTRERLKERFCKVILKAAESLTSEGKPAQAAEYLQSGLSADPSAEGVCQRLLEILLSSGRRPEALALYEKLRVSMAQKHGLEPAPATKAIIERLSGKNKSLL